MNKTNQYMYVCVQKTPEEELTFESMKRVLTESNDNKKEEEAERRMHISETFRTAPFNELMRRTQPKVNTRIINMNMVRPQCIIAKWQTLCVSLGSWHLY